MAQRIQHASGAIERVPEGTEIVDQWLRRHGLEVIHDLQEQIVAASLGRRIHRPTRTDLLLGRLNELRDGYEEHLQAHG